MDKLKRVHFSLTDWEYEAAARWFITTAQYVSSPSSLALPQTFGGPIDGRVSLKEEVSGNLKQGRALTYIRNELPTDRMLSFYIRAQTAPHLGNPANCYRVSATHAVGRMERIVGGGSTGGTEVATPFTWNVDTWYHFRTTWYSYRDASLNLYLRFILEYYEAGEWKHWFTWNDASPLWEDADHNWFGFYAKCGLNSGRSFIDDTEVWKVAD